MLQELRDLARAFARQALVVAEPRRERGRQRLRVRMADEMQPHVLAVAHLASVSRRDATVVAGISATPDSKWIAGTTFLSFTVSSSSAATSRTSTWSPDCVPSTDGSRAHGVNV